MSPMFTAIRWARVIQLHEQGLNYRAIAVRIGITYGQVGNIVRAAKLRK